MGPLVQSALHEHAEYAEDLMPRQAPDPREVLAPLPGLAGFDIGDPFPGDAEIQLMSGVVSEVAGRKAAALIYRNPAMRYSTLFVLADALPIPEGDRLAIGEYRPHYRTAEGRQLLMWRQRGLTYLLVSEIPAGELPGMFLKVRSGR